MAQTIYSKAGTDAAIGAAVAAIPAPDLSDYVPATDTRLSDARTPTAHAASHAAGQADAVTPASIGAQPAGSYAPALGADDNYTTDAEKVKLANLSGTNTGDQTLPTWATIADKPAVIAAGADAAAARAAIGATTLNDIVGGGDVLYVSTTGNDAHGGTSAGTAKATIAAAIAALPAGGGTVHVSAGTYNESGIALRNYLAIIGSPEAIIFSATGDTFTVPVAGEVRNVTMSGLSIYADYRAFGIDGTLALSSLDVEIWQRNGNYPAIHATGLVDTRWTLNVTGTDGAVVPLIELKNTTGDTAIASNTFTGRSTHRSSYVFHIEDATGSSSASQNVIRNWNFEESAGGAVKALSGMNVAIVDCGVYDLPTATTADLIYLGKSPTSGMACRAIVSGYTRAGGALGAGFADIKCATEGGAILTAISCTATSGFKIDFGTDSNPGVALMSPGTWLNATAVVGVGAGVKQMLSSMGNWYPATDLPAGTQFIETTTKKLLTTDGTNWRDAMGNIVT